MKIKNEPNESCIYYFDDESFLCEGYTASGWYFWDETETHLIGPFKNESNAQIAVYVYNFNIDEKHKTILS